MTRPRQCPRCGLNPVGYSGRAFCYQCVPRRRRAPLVCKRCGSDQDFFCAGLCRRCHRSALAAVIDSCRECLAWGVTRREKWLCQACRGWHRRDGTTTAECPSCRRVVVVNARGFCRLCSREATRTRTPHETLDVVGANRCGQQLYFADFILKKRGKRPQAPPRLTMRPLPWPTRFPVTHRQLVLFNMRRNPGPGLMRRLSEPPLPVLAAALAQAVDDHGDEFGWPEWQRVRARLGVRVLLATQDTPGAPISARAAALLLDIDGTALLPVLEVLTSVGMLDDDRQPELEAWFAVTVSGLAEPMSTEVAEWFHALRDGSTITPRTRARNPKTVERSVRRVLPALETWTGEGRQSLREISRDDIVKAVTSSHRSGPVLVSLRSLFRYLKARKIIFTNPTAALRADPIHPNPPLPIDLEPVRKAINGPDTAGAALAALVAFHALRTGELRALMLTDVIDGALHIDDRTIVLAEPARQRIATWIAERTRRWPNTINPHLFTNARAAPRTAPVSNVWVLDKIGTSPDKIRQDRILNEAAATDGDVRRLCDLFGISVGAAERYTAVVTRPDEKALSSRTPGPK